MEFDDLAKKSRTLAYEGKDYETILKAIPINALSEQQQKKLRSLIDDFIVQYNLASQVKAKNLMKMMLGLVALLVGIFILTLGYIRGDNQLLLGGIVSLIGLYVIKNTYEEYKKPIGYQPIAPVKDSKFRIY